MNREEKVEYVVGEVDEFLGAGPVGVYELMEMLNDDAIEPSYDERRAVAAEAFRRIVASGTVRLRRGVWGSYETEKADGEEPTEADWHTPTEAPYLMFEPLD